MAAGRRPGRERRHRIDREPDPGRRWRRRHGQRRAHCRNRRTRCRRHVHGRRRICLRQSQADTEEADLRRERKELETNDQLERAELAAIYVSRGLDPDLARQVADQLMMHDALGAHARDELGISEIQRARPMLAAVASAGTFAVGGALPLLVALLAPANTLPAYVVGTSLAFLAVLGFLAARTGGARVMAGTLRVTFWGAVAMALTYGAGALFGAIV